LQRPLVLLEGGQNGMDLGAGVDLDAIGVFLRFAEVDILDVGVGVGTPQKGDFDHPGYMDVVGKFCLPHQHKGIFGALAAHADVPRDTSNLRNEFRYHRCLF
jgi:hypothetical protein